MPVVFTFSIAGSQPTIRNLLAKTSCEGRKVTVTWDAPAGVTVTEYVVKRSRRTFSIDLLDDVLEVYRGTNTELVDTDLEENTAYYYTVFWTEDGTNYYVSDDARVIGLSIKDFAAREGEHWFYNTLPSRVREKDAEEGDNQYTLRRVCAVLQCGLNLWRGYLDALQHLTDWDKVIAGRIGEPINQYGVMDAVLGTLAAPGIRALGLKAMRRLAMGITGVRKVKGTCLGLEQYVTLITEWAVECREVGQGGCGGGTLLRTWDGSSSLVRGSGLLVAFAGPIDNTAGQLTDTSAAWTPSLYKGGVAIDGLGNVACIEDNTATVVTFEDAADQLQAELLLDSSTVVITGVDEVTVTFPAGSKPFRDHCFKGLKLKDSGGNVYDIHDNGSTSADGLSTVLALSGTPAAGDMNIAWDYSGSRAVLRYTLYNGQHYFLFNPLFDERDRGTIHDPFDVLYGGGGLAGSVSITPGSFDVILWVETGVAAEIGESDTVASDRLELAGAFTPNALVNYYLNPNRNQTKLFRILANTADTIFIDTGDGDLTRVATSGQHFFVLDPLEAVRYRVLVDTVGTFLPYGTKAFVYFQ